MWVKLSDKKPPVGDCKENLLLLWVKCYDGCKYPEFYKGYEMGFFDGKIFFDNNYRYRIDNVEYWCFLHEPPTAENVEGANLYHTTAQV